MREKAPRFTDSHRFKRPYTPSNMTDIRKTFDAARAEMDAMAQEALIKVSPIKQRGKSK